jgi:hypothetical protein
MLDIIQPSNDEEVENIDWHAVWRSSPEFRDVKQELQRLNSLPSSLPTDIEDGDASQHQEFVASFTTQFREVMIRTWKHFWRSPTYTWSKTGLIVLTVCLSLLLIFCITNTHHHSRLHTYFALSNTIVVALHRFHI